MGGRQSAKVVSQNTMDRDAIGSKVIKRRQSEGITQGGTDAILSAKLPATGGRFAYKAVADDRLPHGHASRS